jgi:hypothetical protein
MAITRVNFTLRSNWLVDSSGKALPAPLSGLFLPEEPAAGEG